MTWRNIGGVYITTKNFIDVEDSQNIEFIRCNLKRGVSPRRVKEFVYVEFGESISHNKIYAFKNKVFPDVETIPNLDIIIPCDDDLEDEVTFTSVKNKLLLVLNKQADHLIKNPNDAPIASVSQAIATLDKMELDITNLAPLDDIIDNNAALDVVLKGSKYD